MQTERTACATSEEGRWPQEPTFIGNTSNGRLNAAVILADLLDRNGVGVEVRPEAVDAAGRSLNDSVSIHGNTPEARDTYLRLRSNPELNALCVATNPILSSGRIDFQGLNWGVITKQRVIALRHTTQSEYWRSRARAEGGKDYYITFARQHAQLARDLLPLNTKPLTRLEVASMVMEVVRRELPQI